MVSDPLRWAAVGFALTENATVPFPVPFALLVIVIHDADAVADHAQPN